MIEGMDLPQASKTDSSQLPAFILALKHHAKPGILVEGTNLPQADKWISAGCRPLSLHLSNAPSLRFVTARSHLPQVCSCITVGCRPIRLHSGRQSAVGRQWTITDECVNLVMALLVRYLLAAFAAYAFVSARPKYHVHHNSELSGIIPC
jgi:hypothetical protein